MTMKKPAELEPGMSVYDEAFPLRARFVHSVEKQGKEYVVRFGHPDGEPEEDPKELGRVKASKEYHLIAYADGSRPAASD
jgi:hypothetical protein